MVIWVGWMSMRGARWSSSVIRLARAGVCWCACGEGRGPVDEVYALRGEWYDGMNLGKRWIDRRCGLARRRMSIECFARSFSMARVEDLNVNGLSYRLSR